MLSCRDMAPLLSTHSAPSKRGKGGAVMHQKGDAFLRPQGGCMVFAAKGGIKKGARKGAHLASAAVLYTSRGRSTQPVREASADPGQNPWRPGPKARRRHQPSRRSRVNLREYWKAPPKSRPRRRHHRLSSPILRGDFSTPLRSGRNDDGPATLGPDPDRGKGACP